MPKPPKKGREETEPDQTPTRRALWSGSLGFGLLQIPVALHTAVKTDTIAMHQLDRRDHSPIHYKRVSEQTGRDVPWADIVKGYEFAKGRFVVIDDKDFERVAVRSTQEIDLHDFVPAETIAPFFYDTPYYLAPRGRSTKAYVLFREALRKKGLAAIGTFVLRTREHLCAIFPVGDALVLDVLRFAGEVRDATGLGIPKASARDTFSPRELAMAEQLIDAMRADWQPSRYHDTYREALIALLEKKAKTGEVPPLPAREPASANVVDLMELLKKSLAANQDAKKRPEGRPAKKRRSRGHAA